VKAIRREATKVREGDFREPVVVSPARESTENSSEGTVSRQVSIASFPDDKPDDVSIPLGRTSPLKLPRRTSTITSDIVASVTVSFAPPQGVEATSVQTAGSAPDVLPTPVFQVVAAEIVDEDTDAANTLLREFFERSRILYYYFIILGNAYDRGKGNHKMLQKLYTLYFEFNCLHRNNVVTHGSCMCVNRNIALRDL